MAPFKTSSFNTPDGRYYKTPFGSFPSVTTLLGHTKPKETQVVLEKWAKRLRGEGKDPQKVLTDAGIRGDFIHKRVEHYLLHKEVPAFTTKETQMGIPGFWDSIKPKVYRLRPLFMEMPVYNPVHLYAGRLDLVYDSSRYGTVLRDWKTAEYWRKEDWIFDYKLQTAAYAIAARYTLGITINRIEIVIGFPNGAKCQCFDIDQDQIQYYYDRFCRRVEEYQAKSFVWRRYAPNRSKSRSGKAGAANSSSRRYRFRKTRSSPAR